MTSHYPALSRPPPSIPPPLDLSQPPRRRASIVKTETPQSQRLAHSDLYEIEAEGTGRAAKRRKIDSPTIDTPVRTPVHPAEDEKNLKRARSPSPQTGIVQKLPGESGETSDNSVEPSQSILPLPFPLRPWKTAQTVKPTFEESKAGCRKRKNVPVPNTPDKLELPTEAPKFGKCVGNCSLAGFLPWTNKHPEDVLNEKTAKHGYFDQPPAQLEKEQGSAKASLQHAFKHKLGLDTLSALFSAVLDQRSKYATVSLGSAFKPPPRVTLTETKRKSWLADLANVEVSLRKLSKTVPQGIRGQALLDQCLLNSVPIGRAIWFAKCVGANEIRIMKRAKPSGSLVTCHESKWLKDWTSNVEQFVEAIVAQCGQPEWRTNIQYVLRLCTRIYLDNLLDRDHYLDWIVRSLGMSDVNQIPFWLMVAHIYYQDLIRFRKLGKKLAATLLDKIEMLRKTNEETFLPLIIRLKIFARKLALARPICFLLPDQWWQTLETLKYCLELKQQGDQQLLNYLKRINQQVLGTDRLLPTQDNSGRQKLVLILDSVRGSFKIQELAQRCGEACHDKTVLISVVIEWATSRFRHFSSRVYVAVRLLRRWYKQGVDVESYILDVISQPRQNDSTDHEKLYHLVLELSRSRTFSVSRYLQWLTIKGAIRGASSEPIPSEFSLEASQFGHLKCTGPGRLLTEISTDHLDEHVKNLRNINLSRAGFDTNIEFEIAGNCKRHLSISLPSIVDSPQPITESLDTPVPIFSRLSWSIKSKVAHWLRSQVVNYFKQSANPESAKKVPGMSALDMNEFCVIRNALEQMEDIAVLADVLAVCLSSTQEDLLAAIADTVFHNSEALYAIGAFEDIHQRLCQAYVALRVIKRSMPLLATSMITLCRDYPSKVASLRTMLTDFRKGDRSRAVAACSPFSDGVAESLQQAGETFLEDFEVILQSESNMNEETMTRLFTVLASRISKTFEADPDPSIQLALCQLLSRLRLHRITQCDTLIEGWMIQLLTGTRPGFFALVASLVATSCVTFDTVVRACKKRLSAKLKLSSNRLQNVTDLFSFDGHDYSRSSIHYRLNLCRNRYAVEKPFELLEFATEVKSATGIELKLIKVLPAIVSSIILKNNPPIQLEISTCLDLFTKGLDLVGRSAHEKCSATPDIYSIANSIDDISLPFCQARLKLLIDQSSNDAAATESMAADFFSIASRNDHEHGKSDDSCFSLLKGVSLDIAARVREMAEEAFFASLPAILQPKSFVPESGSPSAEDFGTVQKYLDIALGALQGTAGSTSSSAVSQLIDKLSNFLRLLGTANSSLTMTASPATSTTPGLGPTLASIPSMLPEHIGTLRQYLPLLLQMICLERPSSSNSNLSSKQSQQDQVKILVLLVSIALHPAIVEAPSTEAVASLTSFTLDVAATMIDDLSDEARLLCARFLRDKMRDPRVQFLFGSVTTLGSVMSEDIGAGLQMVKREESGKEVVVGEWKVKQWEVLQGGAEAWVGLGIFGGKKG